MISIVVPTLNERKQIGNLLDSIVAQRSEESLEVVVADAHSTDGTREFVESYKDRLDIRIVDGGRPPVARNSGARAARGELILFTDADVTFPSSSFLTDNVRFFRDRKLSIAAALLDPKSGTLIDVFIFGIGNVSMRLFKHFRPLGSITMLTTREVFEKTGGYPEDHLLCEEHDFVQEVVRHGSYDILPSRVTVSVRRFEKEGRLLVLWKYFYATLYRMLVGPVTKPIFAYEFSYKEHENV